MSEHFFHVNRNFSESDKEACKPIILRVLELANVARTQGLLVLEAQMQQEYNVLLKTGLSLLVDGTNPVIVKKILYNMILADEYSGTELLERLIIAEGVLLLQQGENPRIIAKVLCSMLGEKYISQSDELSDTENKMRGYYQFLYSIRDKKPLPECEQFESKFLHLDNRSIQLVLRSIDEVSLSKALRGCGYFLVQKIFENMSLNLCLNIVEDWNLMQCLENEQIIDSQRRIFEMISDLEKSGQIIGFQNILTDKK